MKKNVVAIVGLETIRDDNQKVKFFADTFLNNIKTWKEENPDAVVKILDARDYKDRPTPIDDMWADMKSSFSGLDLLLFSVHSDWEGLYVISHYRKNVIDDHHRYVDSTTNWEGIPWNPNASIRIMGCQAGGRFGKKWDNSLAQEIANKTGVDVWAFCSRSSQHETNGHYHQIPDTGDYVKFTKVV